MTKRDILEKQWDESLGPFLHYIFYPDQYSEDDHEPAMVFMNILDYVFHEAISMARIRDDWNVLCNIYPFGQTVSFESKKFALPFTFGTHLDKVYVQADIGFAAYLRFMKDDFWSTLSGLEEVGTLTFEAHTLPEKDTRSGTNLLFKNDVSSVYTIMRNYVLLTQADEAQDNLQDFGALRIEWPVSLEFKNLLPKLMESVRRLYRVNYLLYRPYYQQRQKWLKKTFSEFTPEQQELYGGYEGFASVMSERRTDD